VSTTLPRNADVADQFDLLADLLEIEGADSFRVVAYRRAATVMRESPTAIAQMALDGKAKSLTGIGKTIEEKIVQIVEEGEIKALRERKDRIPPGVISFMRLPGLGPKTARRIWQELDVSTVEELKTAAEQERLRALPGLGAKTEENILRALAAKPSGPPRTLLGRALPFLLSVVETLREHPASDQVSEAGSARRRCETVRDLDIIATSADPLALIEFFVELPWVAEVVAQGPTKATVISNEGFRSDLRVVPPECYGNLLQHFTGSKAHNVALREEAVKRGLSVSEYGVKNTESGEVFTAATEDELYEYLGYQFIPPELRENAGELEAARRRELPELVELEDLRGDLHSHSTWSADGKNTIEEMARACQERGYRYLVMTDHSHYLRDGKLEAQWKEIDALNERLAPFLILKGIEVNIRVDGSLDMPDDLLGECDWVVASVHSSLGSDVTERIVSAMQSPHVDSIGHPTGRKINRREPSDLDFGRVVETALETGTFLEIDSQPDRLDLRDTHARAAAEAGLKIAITSDAHQISALDYVEFGIGQARRAWLTEDQVLNTRTWPQLKKLRKK
jgi:DNA polymerase (family X)